MRVREREGPRDRLAGCAEVCLPAKRGAAAASGLRAPDSGRPASSCHVAWGKRRDGMGISLMIARAILQEHRFRPITGEGVLIGRQTMTFTPAEALRIIKEEGVSPR